MDRPDEDDPRAQGSRLSRRAAGGGRDRQDRGEGVSMPTRRTVAQFRNFVVRPILDYLGLASPAAENLLVGTALYESGLEALDQWTGPGDATLGPAFGIYQIE